MNIRLHTEKDIKKHPKEFLHILRENQKHIEELGEEDQKRNKQLYYLEDQVFILTEEKINNEKLIEQLKSENWAKDKQIKDLREVRQRQADDILEFNIDNKLIREKAEEIYSLSQKMFRSLKEFKGIFVPSANKVIREMVHNDHHQQVTSPHQSLRYVLNDSHNDGTHFGSRNFLSFYQHNRILSRKLDSEQSPNKHDSGIELCPEEFIEEKTKQNDEKMEKIETKMEKVKENELKTEKIEEKIEQIEVKTKQIEVKVEQIEEKVEQIEEKAKENEEKEVHQHDDGRNVKVKNAMSEAFRWSKALFMFFFKLFIFAQFFLNFVENTGLYKVIPDEEGGGGGIHLILFVPFVSIEEGPPEFV